MFMSIVLYNLEIIFQKNLLICVCAYMLGAGIQQTITGFGLFLYGIL